MEPKGQKKKSLHWVPLDGELHNDKEVLAWALLTCCATPKAAELQSWAQDVTRAAKNI